MIPPIASSPRLREHTPELVDRDDAAIVVRVPRVLSADDRDEASHCDTTMSAGESFQVVRVAVRRKRVTFADDDDEVREHGSTPEITLHRSPTGAKRRRRSAVCNATANRHLVDESEQLKSRVNQSIPSSNCNCNYDVSERSVVTSSSDEEELLQTSSFTAALPADPRQWTRSDVHVWLRQTTIVSNHTHHRRHHLQQQQQQQPIDVDYERFRMNGKALCLMSSEMFAYRVPHGGHLLYKDFQARLCRAVAESLHRNCTVG